MRYYLNLLGAKMCDIYISYRKFVDNSVMEALHNNLGYRFMPLRTDGSFEDYLNQFNQQSVYKWFLWEEDNYFGFTIHFRSKDDAVLFKLSCI